MSSAIPESASAYIARLVDSRKKAYASDCLACWQQGQPFASEWPNLKAEYVQDVATKMRRYLKVKTQTVKPEPVAVPVVYHVHGSPVPSDAMDAINHHMAHGGELGIGGGIRFTVIGQSVWKSWTDKGDWYVKPEGSGYRVRQGRKSSVYLFAGQLVWMNCECDAVKPEPSPVAEWVEAVTSPEPAKANPQQTGRTRKPRPVTAKAAVPTPLYQSPSRYSQPDEIATATYLSERVVRVCEDCIPATTRPRLIKGARGQKATRFVPFGAYDSEYDAEEKQSHRCIRCGSLDGTRGCYVTQADIDAAISIGKELAKSESFADAAG